MSTKVKTPKAKKQESKNNTWLENVKRFLQRTSYQERLTAILLWQLLNKESAFDEPDNEIGNDTYNAWFEEIEQAANNPEYVQKCEDGYELAMTMSIPMMEIWKI